VTSAGSVELEVKLLKSQLQREVAELRRELDSLKDKQVKVDGDVNPLKAKLKELAGNIAQGIGQGIGQSITQGIGSAVSAGVGAVGGTLKDSLGTAIEFQQQITTFGAVSDASKEQIKGLADEAKRLGLETSKTPVEAAQAAVQLAKLGFTADKVKSELSGVVSLSEASGLKDLGKAAEIAGAAYNVFGRSTKEVADITAATANATGADAQDLLQAISSAGGVAKSNSQSFETLAISFGLLRSAAFTAETAGTAVKTMITRLAAPTTDEAKDAIARLGVSIFDSSGKMRDIVSLIPEFRAKLAGLSDQQKAPLVKTIFGDEGGPAFLALLETSQEKIDQVSQTIRKADGAAGDTAKKLIQGLPGALELLGGSVETLKLGLGEAIAPAFEGLAKLGTEAVNGLLKEDLFGELQKQSEAFREELAQNPELAKALGEALKEASQAFASTAVDLMRSLADTLRENPKAIAQMVEGMGAFIKLMGEALSAAARLATTLGKAFDGYKASNASVKVDGKDVKFGSEAYGSREAALKQGVSAEDFDKRFAEEYQKALKNGPGLLVSGQKKGEIAFKIGLDLGDEARKTKRQNEAIAQSDEAPKARAKAEQAKLDADKKAPPAKEAAKTATLPPPAKPAKPVKPPDPLAALGKETATDQAKADAASTKEVTRIKRGLLTGKDKDQVQEDLVKAEGNAALQNVKVVEGAIARLNAAEQKGTLTKAQATQERAKLEKQLEDATGKSLDAQIKAKELADRRIIESTDRANKERAAKIQAGADNSILAIKQSQLSGQGLVGEGGQTEIAKIEQAATRERLALKQNELQDIQALRQKGVLSAKEARDRELTIAQELRQEKARLLEQETQAVLRQIQQQTDAEKRKTNAIVAGLNQEKAANDLALAGLDRKRSALDGELKLAQAIANTRQSALKTGIDRNSEAVDLFKQIKDQKPEGPGNLRQVLQAQLGELGFNGSDQTGQLAAIQAKNALATEADNERIAAQLQQQALERESVKLGLEKEKISANTAILTAKQAEAQARLNEVEARGALLKAQKTGDRNEIENAKAALDIAGQGVKLAGDQVGLAQQNKQSVEQRGGKELTLLDIQQGQQRNELVAQADQNRRSRERELAGAADALGVEGYGFSAGAANLAPTVPLPQLPSFSNAGAAAAGAQQLTTDLGDRFDRLSAAILQGLEQPRSLTVSSPEPVQDAAKIYADMSRRQVAGAGL
jgi:TP901 family phage tail tape measure protein